MLVPTHWRLHLALIALDVPPMMLILAFLAVRRRLAGAQKPGE